MALWTPAEITTAAWFRPEDSTTVTLETGIRQAADKSGNSRHANQVTTTKQPALTVAGMNSQDIATFDNVDDSLAVSDTAGLQFGTGDFAVLCVCVSTNVSKGSAQQNTIISKNYTGFELFIYQGTFGCYVGGTSNNPTGVAVSSNVAFMGGLTRLSNSLRLRLNGTPGTAVTNSASASQSGTAVYIGSRVDSASNWMYGSIAELIILPAGFTVAEYEYCEGYLAWDWGLEAALRADHPYKDAAPAIPEELIVTGAGGCVGGGSAGVVRACLLAGSGGVVTGWAAEVIRACLLTGSGGGIFGGTADVVFAGPQTLIITGAGGAVVGGSAVLVFTGQITLEVTGVGGAIAGGQAVTSLQYAIVSGSAILDSTGDALRDSTGDQILGSDEGFTPTMSTPTYVRIYLSTANGKEMYHVADVAPGTSSYTIAAGRYDQGMTAEHLFVSPAPAGRIIRLYKGRAYIADEYGTVWYSDPFEFDHFRLGTSFLQFPSVVDIMEPVASGIFFAYGNQTDFYAGTPEDGFNVTNAVLNYGGVYGTGRKVPKSDPIDVTWQSQRGTVVGSSDGQCKNVQEANVAVESAVSGASLIREQNGLRQWIVSLKQPTTSKLAATSFIEAEVIRRGA